ncbi:extracellular solute-binding protein [Paenibacillus nasutitermitis]|uniref:ABC transporter substrate-binding protein n=1 Tax=Paenibacillus nasutitermitis TaxID=1652958 RepID=A0A916YMS4_9BACL|nr:extracellular solute-binding protein [Paenibacillus nasutitermitis]GGD53173.1 ABC transporter substrate-binding protein [Paenibacillus nasutitermitis]
MKFYRKGLVSILAIAMLILAACSNNGSGTAPSSPNQGSSSSNNTNEEYVIKVISDSSKTIKRSDETEIGKVIKEKFNIVFEYVYYTGNYIDKLNLMLAAGDYPEIVWMQGNDSLDKYISSGALLPLDDYLPNAPEFSKRYKEQIPLWRLVASDEKLYKWEAGVPTSFENNVEVLDVGVRIDALEKQGWPNLLSTDDYIKFFKQSLKDFPTTNGQKTIGMVVPFAEPWGMQGIGGIMYEKGGRTAGGAGNLGVIWNAVDKKFVDYMMDEYVKENLQFFNRLYIEGILDKESFTDTMTQINEKLASGRALSHWYFFGGQNQSVIQAGHPELQMINMPIRSMTQMQRNEKRQIRVEDTRSHEMFGITKKAKHPDRIFQLLEWASSDEGQILLQSGIEGKHYTIENGKRVPTEEFVQVIKNPESSSKVGFSLFRFLGNVGTNAPDGGPYSMQSAPDMQDKLTLTDEQKNAFTKLGWKNSKEYFLETGEPAYTGIVASISLDSTSELGSLQQKMVEFRVKNMAKLIIEPKNDAEFEDMYNTVISEYKKMNPERAVDKYNDLYKEKQAQLDKLK